MELVGISLPLIATQVVSLFILAFVLYVIYKKVFKR